MTKSDSTRQSVTVEDGVGREQNLRDLERIRDLFAGNNFNRGFAAVREEYPNIARFFFQGGNLRFTNLRGADLRRLDFRGADLTGCDFEGAQILGARFEMAKVSRAALKTARDWEAYVADWEPAAPEDVVNFHRDPGERFSFSPRLPELVILESGLQRLGADAGLSKAEEHHLLRGSLAVAIQCLDAWEWEQVVIPNPRASVLGGEAARLRSYHASAYCQNLTRKAEAVGLPPGTTVQFASYGLFRTLALAQAQGAEGARAAGLTDLSPADLQAGAAAHEFVERGRGSDGTFIAAAGLSRPSDVRAGRVLLKKDPVLAYLRPVFLLGGVN